MATHLTFPELLATAEKLFGRNNYVRFAIAENRFADAIFDDETIWITNNEGFGIALGTKAGSLTEWQRFTLPRTAQPPEGSLIRGTWDFYVASSLPTHVSMRAITPLPDELIASFLALHSPDASVAPGDPEVLSWVYTLDTSEEISALGAIVKWQSGELCLASIATHSAQRGRGLATFLVSKMVETCAALGAHRVGLGVYAENDAAKQVYKKCGFTLINEFTSYSRS
ncbi:MAG: GNAT family N-acetyltransferase [Actinomycetes bacterium]